MPHSPLVHAALEARAAVRAEYDVLLEATYAQAERECHGVMLNERGRAAGVSSWSLFSGPRHRVDAYASDELREWFDRNGRSTFAQYEAARARSIFAGLLNETAGATAPV